jgi:hypothetical protein
MKHQQLPLPLPTTNFNPFAGFPDYRGPAADAGFSEAAWESAIRLYLSTTPSLN